MNNIIPQLIRQIAKERKRRNMTQEEAANRAGVSQSYWSHVESGKRPVASFDALEKLAHAVGLTIEIRVRRK